MLFIGLIVFISVQIKGTEMGRECGTYGVRKKCVQGCGWELEQNCLERLGLVGGTELKFI